MNYLIIFNEIIYKGIYKIIMNYLIIIYYINNNELFENKFYIMNDNRFQIIKISN